MASLKISLLTVKAYFSEPYKRNWSSEGWNLIYICHQGAPVFELNKVSNTRGNE